MKIIDAPSTQRWTKHEVQEMRIEKAEMGVRYVGDIVGVDLHRLFGDADVRVVRVTKVDVGGQLLWGQGMSFRGRAQRLPLRNDDLLLACGQHSDCRAHLDLAMACATKRRLSESNSEQSPSQTEGTKK